MPPTLVQTHHIQISIKKQVWMSAHKMLFVAEAVPFQPGGGSLGCGGKRKGFQPLSVVFAHM